MTYMDHIGLIKYAYFFQHWLDKNNYDRTLLAEIVCRGPDWFFRWIAEYFVSFPAEELATHQIMYLLWLVSGFFVYHLVSTAPEGSILQVSAFFLEFGDIYQVWLVGRQIEDKAPYTRKHFIPVLVGLKYSIHLIVPTAF